MVNIWHTFDMNEKIVARKFLTQKILRMKLMQITVLQYVRVIQLSTRKWSSSDRLNIDMLLQGLA